MTAVSAAMLQLAFWFLHPCRDIPLRMEHPPHIDVILAFDIEYEIGIAGQLPATQAGQAQFVSIPRRAASWMSGYELVDPFECVDDAERNARSSLASVVVNSAFNIPQSSFAWNDRFGDHPGCRPRARLRRATKYSSSALPWNAPTMSSAHHALFWHCRMPPRPATGCFAGVGYRSCCNLHGGRRMGNRAHGQGHLGGRRDSL
jgi:hypothetical protein